MAGGGPALHPRDHQPRLRPAHHGAGLSTLPGTLPDAFPYEAFPAGFRFGSATSAHQVEGGTENDWTAWEPGHAREVSGRAVEHLTRYRDDLRAAAGLGLDAYRFSIEWSRVEPHPGELDGAVLAHYRDVVAACREHGQEPLVTLHHFTLPGWAARAGGWTSPLVAERFGMFAAAVGRALRGQVTWLCTVNEPEVLVAKGYLAGAWPPARRLALADAHRARKGLRDGHLAATAALRAADSGFAVGFSSSRNPFTARTPALERLARAADHLYNDWFTDRLAPTCDWLGMQYYVRVAVGGDPTRRPRSDMGWELVPELHGPELERLARYGIPLWVTESGLADREDRYRAWYIEASLRSVAGALGAGVDVRGYLHWSLLDNFEWDHGFGPRFGLLEVDRRTMARTPRPSAAHYRDLVARCRTFHA